MYWWFMMQEWRKLGEEGVGVWVRLDHVDSSRCTCLQKGVELQRVSIGHLLAGSIECRVGLLFPTLMLTRLVGGGAARGRDGRRHRAGRRGHGVSGVPVIRGMGYWVGALAVGAVLRCRGEGVLASAFVGLVDCAGGESCTGCDRDGGAEGVAVLAGVGRSVVVGVVFTDAVVVGVGGEAWGAG